MQGFDIRNVVTDIDVHEEKGQDDHDQDGDILHLIKELHLVYW